MLPWFGYKSSYRDYWLNCNNNLGYWWTLYRLFRNSTKWKLLPWFGYKSSYRDYWLNCSNNLGYWWTPACHKLHSLHFHLPPNPKTHWMHDWCRIQFTHRWTSQQTNQKCICLKLPPNSRTHWMQDWWRIQFTSQCEPHKQWQKQWQRQRQWQQQRHLPTNPKTYGLQD